MNENDCQFFKFQSVKVTSTTSFYINSTKIDYLENFTVVLLFNLYQIKVIISIKTKLTFF